MNNDKRQQLVKEFLEKLLDAIKNGVFSKYTLRFAKSTRPFFNRHCVTHEIIKEEIKEFTINNCHYGPSKDQDGYPGDIWEFGFEFRHQEIYIKFRIHNNYISCFRIHVSQKPLKYIFK